MMTSDTDDLMARLLARNRAWAEARKREQDDFFERSAAGQKPPVFWIGCCDSRVVPTELLGLSLGDVFVQTNIANQFRAADVNAASSLEYAVRVLQVRHVVVCGHTRCGGILAALQGAADAPPAVREWLAPLRALVEASRDRIPPGDPLRAQRAMSRINVERQVQAVAAHESVRALWRAGRGPRVHGWLYCLEEGVVEEVCRRTPERATP